jgi:acetyl-CoA synthetase
MTKKYTWQPTPYFLRKSRIARFMQKHGIAEGDWRELLCRSLDPHWFYPAMFEELGMKWFEPFYMPCDDSRGMPFTKWFLSGKINITHNCIERHVRGGHGDVIALRHENEDGTCRTISYAELSKHINLLAGGMKQRGVKKGDMVGMCMTVSPEAAALMFACFKIGAVCVQMATSFSVAEIVSHVEVTGTKIFFMVDGYMHKGSPRALSSVFDVLCEVPQLENIIVLQNIGAPIPEKTLAWNNFTSCEELTETEWCDAEDPALILFSSGTTGTSKRVVHTHGGLLAQAPKEVGFVFDCQETDTFYWQTQFGWMMAPWELIGALFFGASVLLYDGSPLYPKSDRVLRLIEKHGVTIFGYTPSGIRALWEANEKGEIYVSAHDLSSLRVLGSTGDVLSEKLWLWYFQNIGKEKLPIMNIWGGTEVMGCLGYPVPIMPQKPGTVGNHALGIAADVWDENGHPIRNAPGYVVCTEPFPSMTRGFYGNEAGYLQTYFEKFGNETWCHNDRVFIDEDGFWFHLGRSDDLIIRNGTKFDPRKIASALMTFPGNSIRDAAVIGIPDTNVGHLICAFVVADRVPTTHELTAYLKREHDARLVIDLFFTISSIPRNAAAKVPHALIRKAFLGEALGDLSKIVSPESLLEIQTLGKNTGHE